MWGGPSVFSLAEQNVVDVGQVVNESRLGCAVRVVLLKPLDSTSSLTVLGDGYVVAGLHTVSIVKDSNRSAQVSAKDVGRRRGEAANQLVASHGNVVARGSTEAVGDEEEVFALVRGPPRTRAMCGRCLVEPRILGRLGASSSRSAC